MYALNSPKLFATINPNVVVVVVWCWCTKWYFATPIFSYNYNAFQPFNVDSNKVKHTVLPVCRVPCAVCNTVVHIVASLSLKCLGCQMKLIKCKCNCNIFNTNARLFCIKWMRITNAVLRLWFHSFDETMEHARLPFSVLYTTTCLHGSLK